MGCIYGLAGSFAPDEGPTLLDRMKESMRYRFSAPAESAGGGAFLFGAAGDIVGDGQYLVQSDSGNIVAACEGEIYNAAELSATLAVGDLGSATGFDLVPLLFQRHGRDFARHLNGVFTIALWDGDTRTVHLVRDHVGSHSLFYTRAGDLLIFATTARALLATGKVTRAVNPEGPARYFASKALTPPDTMLKDVFAIRPAHVVSLRDGTAEEHDYWRLGEIDVDRNTAEADFVEQVRHVITDAIRIRHDAGGRICSLMSGGLDTGVVSATLAGLAGERGLDVFAVAFEETFYSDGPLQDIMLARYRLRGHQATLRPAEFADIMTKAVGFLDSPVNDNAYVGIFKAFELAKDRGFSAIFEGEGPDEIFPAGNTHGER